MVEGISTSTIFIKKIPKINQISQQKKTQIECGECISMCASGIACGEIFCCSKVDQRKKSVNETMRILNCVKEKKNVRK